MKRLLLPLLAAIALPTAASAESHWLVLYKIQCGMDSGHPCGVAMEKIQMNS
tara:strand:- start:678 stop:833 length:156 start_codon:yes stop_codon:yes gene_type:complete